jgi:hypothetical protein
MPARRNEYSQQQVKRYTGLISMQSSRRITKSSVLSGLRCPKLLWLQENRPDIAIQAAAAAMRMTNGNELGAMARNRYPDGTLIGHVNRPDQALAETARQIDGFPKHPVFEAAFEQLGVLVRSDIVMPAPEGWRLVEVKSSARVKSHHLMDCAVQLRVLEEAGLKVDVVCVAHVNTDFRYQGDENHDGLLEEEDVTERVRALLPDVPAWLESHEDILSAAIPSIRMGGQCKPECPFQDHCEQDLPEYPVSILPNGKGVIQDLQKAGIENNSSRFLRTG